MPPKRVKTGTNPPSTHVKAGTNGPSKRVKAISVLHPKLPHDVCKRLALFASLGSLKTLTLLSKPAYTFYNAILYEKINEPNKIGRLLTTLATSPRQR